MTLTTLKTLVRKYVITGLMVIVLIGTSSMQFLTTMQIHPVRPNKLHALSHGKKGYDVFGFAPYWTFSNLQNIDFNVLTTLAYFSIPVNADGTLNTTDPGYQTFTSDNATQLFTKAHTYGTRVVITVTQMDNATILSLMDNPAAQQKAISQIVKTVASRGIDGVNVDFEYTGDPGQAYRNKFSEFIRVLTKEMHNTIPSSKVTVSVYASAIKDPKIYDIAALGKETDGIFMMAYDFATIGADNAMPTAPLYGYKDGTYWYDVSTAVSDFLTQMPANKLILGVPWYAYNYVVYAPGVKAITRPYYSWKGQPATQTYALASTQITPATTQSYETGWDDEGQVGWKAYYVAQTDTWRMVFMEDTRSLGLKYDFAKTDHLLGIGIWALGFDGGQPEMWSLLEDKFGTKIVDSSVINKSINTN